MELFNSCTSESNKKIKNTDAKTTDVNGSIISCNWVESSGVSYRNNDDKGYIYKRFDWVTMPDNNNFVRTLRHKHLSFSKKQK